MAVDVKIPPVGESITTGTIAQWHQANGAQVRQGDVLLTLETDKVSTELEAEADGVLQILVEEGAEVEIGSVVATIDTEAEMTSGDDESGPDKKELRTSTAAEPSREEPSARPAEEEPAEEEPAEEEPVALSSTGDKAPSGEGLKPKRRGFIAKFGEESARGAAKGKAKSGELTEFKTPLSEHDEEAEVQGERRFTRKKMSPLRRKIATHLVLAQQEAAILTTFNECDMSAVINLRKNLQEAFVAKHGIKLGFMSFFIKAVVDALKTVPNVNGRIDGNDMILNHYYDIGIAVGTERGLIVPTVRDCDAKTFADIEQAIADYAAKAREGKIEFSDLQGGVFTISNGGIYGSMLSTPILNPPQSGILGMHNIQQRPVAVDGQVVIRPMMYLALSYDHRLVDGQEAVTFLIRVKECIENPTRLLIEA